MSLVYTTHADQSAGGGEIGPDEDASSERLTESERVYQALKRAILAGEFAPGKPLQEVRLAAALKASRTPVREAFRRLEGDGLLSIMPRRGAFVQQPTARDFFNVNELRLLLEPAAARKAAALLSAARVHELQERLAYISADAPSEADFASLEALDRLMHSTIAEAIQNERMRKILESLNDLMQVLRERDMRLRHQELHVSIGDILSALAARDADAAEASMRRHVCDFSSALGRLA